MTVIRKTLVLVFLILLTAVSIGSGTLMAWRAVLHAAQSQIRSIGVEPRSRATVFTSRDAIAVSLERPVAPLPANQLVERRVAQTATSAAQPAPSTPTGPGVEIRRIARPVLRIGQDYRLPAGESVREVVIISGGAVIEGTVERDVVVVVGRVRLASTAVIHGQLTVVGGSLDVESGAEVRRELVVIGGAFNAPPEFSGGAQHVVIGQSLIGDRIDSIVPWITGGLMLGRPLVLGLGWVWSFVLVCFLAYLIIALVFDRSVRACSDTLVRRPLGAFLTGLLVLLLFGPVMFILGVSIVGIIVMPFVLCALVIAWIVGKVGLFRWVGASVVAQDEPENKLQSARSFVLGFVIVTLIYLVPVLGLVAWATIGVWGLGAASLTFMTALRKENPNGSRKRAVPPVPPPAPPAVPPYTPAPPSPGGYGAPVAPVAFTAVEPPPPPAVPGDTSGEPTAATSGGAAAWASSAGIPPAAASPYAGAYGAGAAAASMPYGAPGPADLLAMPHAAFIDRAAAFGLDVILVLFINGFMPRLTRDLPDQFFFLLLMYHVAFWTWKATTVGGIICNLRLVRSDGAPLRFADALLRGLASIFSLVVAGLGALWILKDPERQSWHDRIAGTYVVKVPRSYPIT